MQVFDTAHRNSEKRIVALVEKARTEAAIRRKAAAFRVISDEIKSNGKSAFTAAKYLIEEQWVKGSTKDARAARKDARETAEEAFKRSGIQEDLKRLPSLSLLVSLSLDKVIRWEGRNLPSVGIDFDNKESGPAAPCVAPEANLKPARAYYSSLLGCRTNIRPKGG